jgi:threonine synthase
MDEVGAAVAPADLAAREPTLWRYRELLPDPGEDRVCLGEGFTPLLPAPRLGEEIGVPGLLLKDESLNPTGSFKARGMATAVSMAKALGARVLALPSAGNAGSAAAAYGSRAGLTVELFLPEDTPEPFRLEAAALGANIHQVPGSIADCGAELKRRNADGAWWDLSTLKEPYRLEGKKTMGLELAEQLGWELPEVIVYPTGGGTGLIGMWKAFEEMEQLGWIDSRRPRMVSVQASGCAPIVRALERGDEVAEVWKDPRTEAAGLRVPGAVGDFLILRAIRDSGGTAVAVSDETMRREIHAIGRAEGIATAPEGGATLAAARQLREAGWIGASDRVVLFLTGTGLKYPESMVG